MSLIHPQSELIVILGKNEKKITFDLKLLSQSEIIHKVQRKKYIILPTCV
jgi:hypothetical protein